MSEKHSIMFGTMDSGIKFISLICPPSFVGGSPTSWLEESHRSKFKVSCLQKFTQKQVFHNVQTWVHYCTKHQYPSSNHQTDQLTPTTRCRKMRWHRPTSNHWPWKWWSDPYTDTFGTVLGLRIKRQHDYLVVVFSRCHKHPKMVGPCGG